MKRKRKTSRVVRDVKLVAFASVLTAMCVLGLLWFLRPDTSMVEKRKLAAFPAFTLQGLWDGSYFADIDTWYADTYPLREVLIDGQQRLESRYGLRGTQLVGGSTMVADAIPDADAASDIGVTSAAVPDATATPAPTPTATPAPDGTVHAVGEFNGNIYITQNAAYGTYYFSQAGADEFVATIDQVYQNIKDKVANVYTMQVPLSSAVMLDEAVIADMGCSDEGAAIDYLARQMDPGIQNIRIVDTLRQHNAEYIYFRTDHHWTQLGAYYAYQVFCRMKGWTPHTLDQFRTREFGAGAYLGSYYTSSNKSPQLAAAPDTVQAWYPLCTDESSRDMYMVQRDGSGYEWRIINDMFDFPDSEWYCIFSAADQPFSSLHNPDIHDGSAVLVVKDSYGNAFIPWLVDHYEYTYWVDFRYTDETVSHMVETYGVQDVIFETATFEATSDLCNDMLLRVGC